MTQRRLDVDIVRFLALMAMFIAHVAPTNGPADLLGLSEFVTMPLFALIVGVGAQLGEWGAVRSGNRARWWRSMVVRAAVLIGVGWLLTQAGAQILIVLGHLGVLVVVMDLIARLPWWGAGVAGLAAFVVTPMLVQDMGERAASLSLEAAMAGHVWEPDTWWEVQMFLFGYEPYRLGSMITYACLGLLLTRWWLRRDDSPRWHQLVVGLGGLGLAGAVLVVRQTGRIEVEAYSGTHLETLVNMGLVTAVLGLGMWGARFLPAMVSRLLAATGAMTLTLYAGQILWLAYDVRVLHPGTRDDSWTNLAILAVGSLVITAIWTAVIRRGPWRRGPLEGVTALLVR